MGIHPRAGYLPTTQKLVASAILKSQITNDPDVFRYMFLENKYTSPQLLSMVTSECNIMAVGTFSAKICVFYSEALKLDNKVDRLSFILLVENPMGVFLCRLN